MRRVRLSNNPFWELFPLFGKVHLWFLEKHCIIIILRNEREVDTMFILLAGGLLIVIVAVVIAVVASVTSAVAADTDEAED